MSIWTGARGYSNCPMGPRNRATGKKSRDGCKTCKIRRVKCDEAKPFCIRCKEMHIACDGYEIKVPKSRDHTGHFFPILPKGQVAALTLAAPKFITIILEPQPVSNLSDLEAQYFDFFRHNTTSALAEYLDNKFWNRIVLQATEQTLPIKHSVIAIGALHKTLQQDPCTYGQDGNLQQNPHYRFALQQYGKALKLTRAACVETKFDIRTLLISCFLSTAFEGIHGSTDAAVAHIQSGLSILNEYCSKQAPSISTAENALLPNLLEDEVVSVFARMETDVIGLFDADRVLTMHPNVQAAVREVFTYMPTDTFESLTSARKYLDLLLREVGIFVTSCNEQQWNVFEKRESMPISETCVFGPDLSLYPTVIQETHLAGYQDCLVKWQHTFSSLEARVCSEATDARLATTALSLRVTCASISLACCFGAETSYDAFIPEFETALQLAQTLHASGPSSKSTRPTFIMSSILIRSLYFIAVKCRSLRVRVGALRILEGMRRREGIWDAGFVEAVVKCIVAVEEGQEKEMDKASNEFGGNGYWYEDKLEEGSDRDLPPENRRVLSLKISFDVLKRKGHIRFLHIGDAEYGMRFVAEERNIEW
ncbi:uncharacterized protein RCO7_02594 [Rhynchosporium graminicola]|uniref:Zn(2)-C6 fungal-type domain-containing protein n=1 Tax=Rhynchosporium graminicola TaxID=2792576 RepID=A0A1E1KFE6_9HELO|nr:uncharacterized protein RCO7_02594 [Rhynchosporium commune]